ncbi:hypothetical protein Q2T94_04175 [Paeniglutamicibacter sulfureus]|uniref:hypothetical protein n=1 Tax=Paeniglutamicibacter sulfureus TaxID=43666 RepID=UPI0026662798|nr:hypothetical protein [Paeniglutamicibacter sulfureus]MDO2933504.1 hypothetical protein [Paeniglutamicibacter sulfureus]
MEVRGLVAFQEQALVIGQVPVAGGENPTGFFQSAELSEQLLEALLPGFLQNGGCGSREAPVFGFAERNACIQKGRFE